MSNVRGRGTLVAWDHETMQQRDQVVGGKNNLNVKKFFVPQYKSPLKIIQSQIFILFNSEAMKNGLLLGGCGTHAIRLRPSLVFERRHAEEFLELLSDTLRKV